MISKAGSKITVIDMNEVSREISAAHTRIRNWEKNLSETPAPHDHWNKLAEYAGPNLKQALSLGLACIEIPTDGKDLEQLGKPRFVLQED